MSLFRTIAGFIDASMIVIATGRALTAGTVFCFCKRASDQKWLHADATWQLNAPVGQSVPVMTAICGGLWTLAHTPADQNDTYAISCIDSGETCYPDNRTQFVGLPPVSTGDAYTRLGQPAGSTVSADLGSILAAVEDSPASRLLFDAASNVLSSPRTAVTVNPAQVLGGALQPLLPITSGRAIEAAQGDAYPIPWALGSQAAKSGARFLFIAKLSISDSDEAAAIVQEITIVDPANVVGMNVLSTEMTGTIAAYHAKVLRVDDDGVSNPLTVWKGRLNIVPNVG